jgi:hypothetical protein
MAPETEKHKLVWTVLEYILDFVRMGQRLGDYDAIFGTTFFVTMTVLEPWRRNAFPRFMPRSA